MLYRMQTSHVGPGGSSSSREVDDTNSSNESNYLGSCTSKSDLSTPLSAVITSTSSGANIISKPSPDGHPTPRRSSSRSIKRKKFDDELVESSLKKPVKRVSLSSDVSVVVMDKDKLDKERERTEREIRDKEKKAPMKSSTKRQRKMRPTPVPKDLGRWRPTDDLLLISAVQQTNDLTAVHLGVKFSCRFTLKDIQERWYQLLYDPTASRLATMAMKQLPADIITACLSNALWSKEEETVLGQIPSNSPGHLEVFQDLLDKNISVFHPYRTAKSLYNHWLMMRLYQLLPDQTVPTGEIIPSFSDVEENMDDSDLLESKDDALEQELAIADRRQKHEIRLLEEEIPKWQMIVDNVTGTGGSSSVEFDGQTLAVVKGRLVRYLMRSKEISVGRNTADSEVDVDLSLEGPAWKVSRRQATIKLKNDGEYYISNEGRRPIYIDGKPITCGGKSKLHHNAMIEVCSLKFVFLINTELTAATVAKEIPKSS